MELTLRQCLLGGGGSGHGGGEETPFVTRAPKDHQKKQGSYNA